MRNTLSILMAAVLLVAGTADLMAQESYGHDHGQVSRPIPYPVDISRGFQQALGNGTRSPTGEPGPNYWQQWTDYTITARLDTAGKRIDGTVRIVYHNRSPQSLSRLALQLLQNVHSEGAVRNRRAAVTGGMEIKRLRAMGQELPLTPRAVSASTTFQIRLPSPLAAGASAVLELDFGFEIPRAGAGGRMGWSRDNMFYLAYWYPQMAVYDDVGGWQTDAFLGNSEFYMGYGSYDVTLEIPEGWVTMGTGRLVNADEVMPAAIVARLREAETSDDVVHVITADDFGPGTATQRSESGYLSWHFLADSVRDVAYSITRESLWDAARTPVGDRDGDGSTDYVRVDAIYRETAPRWQHAWRYVQHSIDFLSRWTGFPYPWPHMTAVEGDGIMGGGMEYPMMTLIGGFTQAGDTALYGVTAHELAHMWVPMIVGNDERRMAWMDEGTTSFNGGAASNEFFPGRRWDLGNYNGYMLITRTGLEGPIMRWSDHHYNRFAYGTASYSKPATLLWTLRGLLGEETFEEAYQAYVRRWAFKHPQPWDFFNTFNDVSGRTLDWFWRTWYYETWALDQGIAEVTTEGDSTRIVVVDLGRAPMPVRLTITTADGATMRAEIPVERWLEGARTAEIVVQTASRVVRVEIDAEQVFPDTDRDNNVWERP
ncbi:MAG: M1 family metallopeptidase [Gemmatimonadetes bacterium]|nr:M1 family metallopeptidase [Gemmatimonadota bacterium]